MRWRKKKKKNGRDSSSSFSALQSIWNPRIERERDAFDREERVGVFILFGVPGKKKKKKEEDRSRLYQSRSVGDVVTSKAKADSGRITLLLLHRGPFSCRRREYKRGLLFKPISHVSAYWPGPIEAGAHTHNDADGWMNGRIAWSLSLRICHRPEEEEERKAPKTSGCIIK